MVNRENKLLKKAIKLIIVSCLLTLSHINFSLAKNTQAKTFHNSRYAAFVMDPDSGTILHQENATKPRHPASLTKMMTLYMVFDAIKSGKLEKDQLIEVSPHAASMPKSNVGLKAGEIISLQDAIMATIVKSANDAAVALGEAVYGDEKLFALMMTRKAHSLGMHHSFFRNASGWHHAQQRTTAHDMAKLAVALKRDFPQYYHLFAKTSFNFKGNVYTGHNHVLKNYPGATGLKTGFVNASGFNLVTSAKRGENKLIGVVLGGNTARARDSRMVALLDKYFANTENVNQKMKLAVAKQPAPVVSKEKKQVKKKQAANVLNHKHATKKKRTSPFKLAFRQKKTS
jgi:D-alanyl-D-alanine carboxypeptidase